MRLLKYSELIIGLAVTFLGLATSARSVAAEIPAGPEAFTNAKLGDELLKYEQREIDIYQKSTTDPPQVRGDAIKFIKGCQLRMLPEGRGPTKQELIELGESVLKSGSKDPLVVHYFARILSQRDGTTDRVKQLAASSADRLIASSYPIDQKLIACRNMFALQGPEGARNEDSPDWILKFANLLSAWVGDPAIPARHRMYVWYTAACDFAPMLPPAEQAEIVDLCNGQPQSDQWTLNMLAGWYHHTLAWQARGAGLANTVTRENAAQFKAEIELAAAHFTKAWELHKRWAAPAAAMVQVTMTRIVPGTPRQWFDRAVAAQLDYMAAYRSMAFSLRPRWGGSLDAMHTFGVECAATQRYDTSVPLVYRMVIDNIAEETQSDKIWRIPGAYQTAKEVYQATAADPSRADKTGRDRGESWVRSTFACLAIRLKEFQDARDQLDKLGDRIDRDVFEQNGYWLPLFPAWVYASTGPAKDSVVRLTELRSDRKNLSKQRESATKLFHEARQKDKQPKAAPYYEFWTKVFQIEADFEKGDWVRLPATRDGMNWSYWQGKWQTDRDGAMVGNPTDNKGPAIAVLYAPILPVPLELEVDVAPTEINEKSAIPSNPRFTGVFVGGMRRRGVPLKGRVLGIGRDGVSVGHMGSTHGVASSATLKEINHLHVRCWETYFDLQVNQQETRPDPGISTSNYDPTGPIGLITNHRAPVRFMNLRVRKLSSPSPAGVSAEAPN